MTIQNLLHNSVAQALETAYQELWQLAGNDFLFRNTIATAFGKEADASAFQTAWVNRDFSDCPEIEICRKTEINGANGAFAAATGKIYLAQEFIDKNVNNLDAIVAVLLEEYGHFIDSQINTIDAAGDEGDIFARLVQGKIISQQELAVLQAEDDKATMTLGSQVVGIEMDVDGAYKSFSWWLDNAGNDAGYMKGSDEDEWIGGRGGNDVIKGGSDDDLLRGEGGDDTLYGQEGDDTLEGREGGDDLYSSTGKDYLDGGDDWDTVHYEDNLRGITVDGKENKYDAKTASTRGTLVVHKNSLFEQATEKDLLWDVEEIYGTNKKDTIFAQAYEYSNFVLNIPLKTGLRKIHGGDGDDHLFIKNYNITSPRSDPFNFNQHFRQEKWLYGDSGKDILYGDITKDGIPQNLFGGDDKDQDAFILGGSFEKGDSEEIAKALVDYALGVFAAANPVTGVIAATGTLLKTLLWKDETSGETSDVVIINDFNPDKDIIILPKLDEEKQEFYQFIPAENSVRVKAYIDSVKGGVIIARINTDTPKAAKSLADKLETKLPENTEESDSISQNLLRSEPGNFDSGNKIVGGYYPEWGTYDRNFQIKDVPADKLTHLFYAFAQIDQNGKAALFDPWAAKDKPFPDDAPSQELKGNLNQLRILKEQHPNLKNMLSIGGWSLSGPFSTIASTPASRNAFAKSAVELMTKYRTSDGSPIFDGIDIDWEYPVGGGASVGEVEGLAPSRANKEVKYTPADKQNYVLLLKALRKELYAQANRDSKLNSPFPYYQLSIASAAGAKTVKNFDLEEISKSVDFFNVMAYDFHGSTFEPNKTNHQAALYGSGKNDVDSAIQAYVKKADSNPNDTFDRSDVVMGVPAYGRAWVGVPSTNDGLLQPANGTASGTWERGIFDYKDLHNRLQTQPGTYKQIWDDTAKVPYIYSSTEGGMFSTYENKRSIGAKTKYIRENGLGGMFFWDLSSDLPSNNPDSLVSKAASALGTSPA